MINIILRTSGRPNYFRNCLYSIIHQHYTDWKLWITVDDDYTANYVKEYGLNYIKMDKNYPNENDKEIMKNYPGMRYCGYNLYFNRVLDKIQDGYIMYLDDDDAFKTYDSLETIARNLRENHITLWKVGFPGKEIPEPEYFGKKPEVCHISGIGFAHPVTWRRWDCFNCGDYRFINELYKDLRNVWVPEVLTCIQRNDAMGGFGKMDDL